METMPLGATGLEVSRLGFGAAPIGYLDTEPRRVRKVLESLLDSGVNVIDTAACYPGSEALIGSAVGHRRDEYVLVTKCGHSVEGVRGKEWSARLIGETVDRALRRLRTDVIDVMLLHSCAQRVLERGEAVAALVKARDAGKLRFLGYSGDNETAAYAAGLADVSVIETSVSVCDQRNLDVVLPRARERGLGVLAKRPIANAAWKDLSSQPGLYASYARTYTDRLARMGITPADAGFEEEPAAVWHEVALRFTLSHPGVHVALVGTTDPANARANVDAARKGPLPEAAVAKLREAFRRAEAKSGKEWPGET